MVGANETLMESLQAISIAIDGGLIIGVFTLIFNAGKMSQRVETIEREISVLKDGLKDIPEVRVQLAQMTETLKWVKKQMEELREALVVTPVRGRSRFALKTRIAGDSG
jgi:hypothetical protein